MHMHVCMDFLSQKIAIFNPIGRAQQVHHLVSAVVLEDVCMTDRWMDGWMEGLKDWKIERLKDWKIERLEDWKIERLKDWKIER